MVKKLTLHEMRKESGLGTTEIAHTIGISYPTLLNWEKGRSTPDAISLKKLLELYNRTNDELDWDALEQHKQK